VKNVYPELFIPGESLAKGEVSERCYEWFCVRPILGDGRGLPRGGTTRHHLHTSSPKVRCGSKRAAPRACAPLICKNLKFAVTFWKLEIIFEIDCEFSWPTLPEILSVLRALRTWIAAHYMHWARVDRIWNHLSAQKDKTLCAAPFYVRTCVLVGLCSFCELCVLDVR
jgi:hypothetical protein